MFRFCIFFSFTIERHNKLKVSSHYLLMYNCIHKKELLALQHQIKQQLPPFNVVRISLWESFNFINKVKGTYSSGFLRKPQKVDGKSQLIYRLLTTYLVRFKLTGRFCQIFVAFLENLNFINTI